MMPLQLSPSAGVLAAAVPLAALDSPSHRETRRSQRDTHPAQDLETTRWPYFRGEFWKC